MKNTRHSPLIRRALISNASDASGTQLYDTIVSIIVVSALGFSATQVGLLNALGSLSFLILVVPLGMVVDSWGPGRVLVVSLGVKLILTTATFVLLVTGALTALGAFAVVTLLGVAAVASENAQTTIVPRIATGTQDITDFISRMSAADRVAGIVAPAAAGVLAALSGGSIALALSAACVALAMIAALRLRAVPPGPAAAVLGMADEGDREKEPRQPLRTQMLHGFVVLGQNRFLLGSTLLVAVGNIGLALGDAIEPILVLRELHLNPGFYGLLGSIGAVAGIGATFVAARVTSRFTLKRIFVVGAWAQALVATLPLLSLLVPPAAYITLSLFEVLWAVTLTVTNIAGAAYAAQAVSAESLGRAAAARRMVTMGSVPVASLASGALADLAGLAAPLIIWPVLTAVAALAFLVMSSDHGEERSGTDGGEAPGRGASVARDRA